MAPAPSGRAVTVRGDLRIRGYRGNADIPAIVSVVNAAALADEIEEIWTEDGTRAWFGHPTQHFDAGRDVIVVELDGAVVAAGGADWVDTRDGQYRELRFWGAVHPDHRGRGIGSALLAERERRALVLAAEHPSERPWTIGSLVAAGRPGAALLAEAGYEPVRWFFEMLRPTLDGVVEPPMPDGLELRPVLPGQLETIWFANREAFRDHWGGSDESLDSFRRILADPDTETDLWLIAWDRDEVAGGIWNVISAEANATLGIRRGWLDSVFTRRAYRGRGLASALIGRSMSLLRERGMTSAALGVDADNPTGALGLYEAAGFEVHDRLIFMRKDLGP